ncbi:MAG: UbiA family prenyltransferase [Gemmatimonadota bacterium]|jgi:4-hydroxybenzoate polyprenyltransferase/phosphoserine phosphatase
MISSRSPIFVDLDGTLVATDTLHEAFFALCARSPVAALHAFLVLGRGRAAFKRQVLEAAKPRGAPVLPYRTSVLTFLRGERKRGRPLVLVTASDQLTADAVADDLSIFDLALGSDGKTNLEGKRKLEAIQRVCAERGWSDFGYVGDARADLAVWAEAADVYVAGAHPAVVRQLQAGGAQPQVIATRPGVLRNLVRACRPHQWAKNTLVFVPLLLAHEWNDGTKLLAATLAFVAFSLAASAMYLVNDLLDLESDRKHARKKHRPFAAGDLPVVVGPIAAVALVAMSATLTVTLLPVQFGFLLLGYLVTTQLYSLYLKKRLLLDVFTLALLYILRVLGGGLATGTLVTQWLLAFAGFLFTSLAFAKRYTELAAQSDAGAVQSGEGRGYGIGDLGIIESVGPTSGYLAGLVLALYINSSEGSDLYANPLWLWLLCPLVLYWITRVWFVAKRRQLHTDPVVFALTDRVSLIVGLIGIGLVLGASYGWGPVLFAD